MESSQKISHGRISFRAILFIIAIFALMMILLSRLFYLQIINAGLYKFESTRNHVLEIPIKSPRGDILDRNGVKLAQNHVRYDLYLASIGDQEADNQHLLALGEIAGLDESEIEAAKEVIKRASGEVPVLVKSDIPLNMAIELREKGDIFKFALIDKSTKRSYPYGELTSHVLGYLREIDERRLKELRDAGYSAGDLIGEYGIEHQYDTTLRGIHGRQLMEVNHLGHWVGLLSRYEENDDGEIVRVPQTFPASKGSDIHLTIDIELQRRVAIEMGEFVGGVAIMDVHSGEILALYSYPTFDANLFIGRVPVTEWVDLLDNPEHPLQNRIIQNAYPPGSIYKPVVALAGFNDKKITRYTTTTCTGNYEIGGRVFRCWLRHGHGTLSFEKAMAHSCDVYYYQLGERLGVSRIRHYSSLLGFGDKTGIDIPGERPGLLPSPEWKENRLGEKWYAGDTINMSIGQGFLQVTPIQSLRMFAFFANGGKMINPHINSAVMTRDETPNELKDIDPSIIKEIHNSLRTTVVSGTARACYFPDPAVAGKTGTAEDPPRKLPHSWFVSYAPFENPKLVMIVFGQNAGGSGDFAVPVSRKIYQSSEMRKYLITESLE